MADEVKETAATQEKKEPATKILKTILKGALGLILVVVGIVAIVGWWSSVWQLIKGCLGFFLILAGAIFIAIAKE